MNALMDADARRVARAADDEQELNDSWFEWPKLATTPPPSPSDRDQRRPSSDPPPRLDDGLADAWFR
jgi:hypothetical protein